VLPLALAALEEPDRWGKVGFGDSIIMVGPAIED
jgi:hypothetical protein